jgi:hypothetical protein
VLSTLPYRNVINIKSLHAVRVHFLGVMTEISTRRIMVYVVIKNLTISLLWKAEGQTLTTLLDVFSQLRPPGMPDRRPL